MDNVVAVEFLKLTGRAARMQAFTGGDASVPPLELEDTHSLTPHGSAYVSLAHGNKGSLLGSHSVATNRGAQVCSGRGLCEERTSNGVGGGSCTCQEGFIASDGLVLGGPGGLRLKGNGLPHPGEGQGTKNPALRFQRDSLPSPAYEDCGALDPAVFPSAGYATDRAAGEGKGVGGGACPGTASGTGFGIQCSGHGACSGAPVWQCACEVGWNGYDCSLRACPTDRAWFDFPRANDEAHWALQECAGRGHSNRELGVCECEAGFRGAACATLDCPVGRIRSSTAGGVFDYNNGGSDVTSKSTLMAQQQLSDASGFTQLRGKSSTRLNQVPSSYDTSPGAVHQSVHHAVSGSSGTSSGGSHSHRRSSEPDAPPGFDEHNSEIAEVVYEATTDASTKRGGSSAPLRSSRSANAIGLGPGWTLPPPGTTCSGHGVCLSQSEHARRALDSEAETDLSYGPKVSSRTRYSAHFWDADRLSGCLCDFGWTGYDCSLRTCPRGDDPSSYGQVHDDQLLRCLADPHNGTTWYVKFRRDGSALAAPESAALAANASAEDVQRAIEGLSTVGSVEVTLLNGEQVLNANSGAVQNATESCAPRRAGDALLVMPEAPSLLFTGTPRQLRVALTAWPASAITVTITCRLDGPRGAPCNDASEVHVWPRNFTFLPRGAHSSSGNSNLPVTGAAPPPQFFNVTASASGRYALTAAWGSGGNGGNDDDSGAFVALANASTHAATALSGTEAQANAGAHTILRAFCASADSESTPKLLPQLATPDLGALNLTLLPGSTEKNLTVALSEEAWAQLGSGGCYTSRLGSGCDNDNYGDDLTKTLVVTPTATTVSSSSSGSGVVILSFEPSSVTLSRANPSASFAVRAASSSAAGSAHVVWSLSGALAANVSAPGTLSSTDSSAATISVAHVAKVLPPPRLPPVYRSAASAVLTLRLASSPPIGSGNLTVTPTLRAAIDVDDDDSIGNGAQGAAAAFDPPSLVFVPGGPRSLGFRIVGRRVGLHNLTYELSGGAASLYQVSLPRVAAAVLAYAPGGDGGDDSASNSQAAAVAVAAGAWPLTVAAAPVLRVRFLTESGALPRLRARANQVPVGADPGAHVEIYSSGAVALGEYAATPTVAAVETQMHSTVVSESQSNGMNAGTALAVERDLVSVTGTTEAAECSDRGICDRALGTCRCFDGYRSSDGNGKAGTRGDCGFLVPDIESLWENQQPPSEVVAEARD